MAEESVTIFGKDTWPHTTGAREAFAARGVRVDYRNVTASKQALEEMLRHSGGRREVPVILQRGKVEIGWEGSTWGV